jgi:hypothetical protein
MSDNQNPIRVWCLLRDQFAHVKPVEESLGKEAGFVYDQEWNTGRLLEEKPDIVICVNDFHYDVACCLEAARANGIPSLAFQDGILEWRCQYENPKFGAGGGAPQHQPVLADKIACLGAQSARQIAAWGNAEKVEVAGMPRLDYLLEVEAPPTRKPGTRILVMTAKNPGFTPEQREITVRSLKDLKAWLDARANLEVFWRVSPKVVNELGVENQYEKAVSQELTVLLNQVDAVITTPSTAILEAMLLKRPVAALDYHNVPRFVATAWTISAKDHIQSVVNEVLDPPPRKLAFQRDCLNDCLRCDGNSAPRVAALIREMVRLAHAAKTQGSPLKLPPNMLQCPCQLVGTNQAPPLDELYPEHSVFREKDIVSLQLKIARLESEKAGLQAQVKARNIPAFVVSTLYRWWKKPRRSKAISKSSF